MKTLKNLFSKHVMGFALALLSLCPGASLWPGSCPQAARKSARAPALLSLKKSLRLMGLCMSVSLVCAGDGCAAAPGSLSFALPGQVNKNCEVYKQRARGRKLNYIFSRIRQYRGS